MALNSRLYGDERYIEAGVRNGRYSLGKNPDGPDRIEPLHHLGIALEQRYKWKRDIVDLDKAINLETIKYEPENCNAKEIRLLALKAKYCLWDLQSRDTKEREGSMTLTNEATKSTSKEELENRLQTPLKSMGDKNNFEAIAQILQQLIVGLTPGRCDPNEAARLGNLAGELEVRFLAKAEICDLEKAIELARLAVELTSEGHPTRAQELCNLGRKLRLRYNQIGEVYDIEDAIRLANKAAGPFPEGVSGRAGSLSNLGEALYSRYHRIGEKKDLEDAILAERQAADLAPEATVLSSLGNKLHERYERTGDIYDLTEAIQVTQRAIQLSSESDPSSASLLSNLGDMLHSCHRRTKEIQDLHEAILVVRQAIVLNSEAAQLTSLGNKLQGRYERTEDIYDLTEAVQLFQRAVKLTLENDPIRASRLCSLVTALESRYLRKARAKDLDGAVRCFCRSSNSPYGQPLVCLRSGREAIRIFHERGDWEKAFLWAKSLTNLLQYVSNRYSNLEDQQHAITQISGFSADVCSLAVKVGNTDFAIQMLEHGRGMIVGYMIDSRNEYPQLKKDYPALAERYDLLREEIRMPAHARGPITPSQLLKEQREIIPEINDFLHRIRQKPGYERFLLEPTIKELKSCAVEGPIVVINITDIGADAIIVSTCGIKTIPLVGISPKTVPSSVQLEFKRYKLSRRGEDHTRKIGSETEAWAGSMLEWLWYCCVKPVLDDLEISGLIVANDIARIWWIGSGIATSFPFHAAGADFRNSENTLSRVISSYSPTIKALAYSRMRAIQHDQAHWGDMSILVITMPTTPGQNPLPGVEREREAIWQVCKEVFSCEHLDLPTAAEALERIAGSEIVHFACHGSSDSANPSASHLLLQSSVLGKTVLDRLTVSSISSASVEGRARIAFLSACSTAETKTSQLTDEGLHLASAFQVAGFAHVIGSLWSADDDVCVRLVELFYMDLIKSGNIRTSNRSVALALRNAILQVRSEFPDDPSVWAPFIHFGV